MQVTHRGVSMSRTLVPDEVRNIFGISPVYTKADRKLLEKIEREKRLSKKMMTRVTNLVLM